MKDRGEILFSKAINAVLDDEPGRDQMAASATRLAGRLGIATEELRMEDAIESCGDVRRLSAAYKAGTLPSARKLLVDVHLKECGACLRFFRGISRGQAVDWSVPTRAHSGLWQTRNLGWGLAVSFGVLACVFFFYRAYWEVPPGVRAEVQSIGGEAYLSSATGDRQLAPGTQLHEGDQLRTAGESRAVLRLADGSTVEVNERSVLEVGARGHSMTIALDRGAAIVEAAKRDSGHLYVKTPDCRIAVTGTVFSVSSGLKGSRVGVLQGTVQVAHSGVASVLHAGDQMTTSDNLAPAPLAQTFAWSQDRGKYLELVSQLAALQHSIEQIPFPQLRYSSDLLNRVPSATVFYTSIPNLGNFLSEANKVFREQLSQSPTLQQWWTHGHGQNTADLDALVEKIHTLSQYLGDEIVIAGIPQANESGLVVIADVEKPGLDALLRQEFPSSGAKGSLVVLNEESVASVRTTTKNAMYALVGPHEVVLSNSIAALRQVNAQLEAGASGFAGTDFGRQIASAYNRGAGIILAANLHQMIASAKPRNHVQMASIGMESVQYLIAEHRDTNQGVQNHLNLQFAGARHGVASWLGRPAPIGSLEFVSSNAAIAVAGLSKDPGEIADDILAMVSARKSTSVEWNKAETEMQINFREDLIANLGGDFLLALDGPVLPTPAWKAVVEIRNPVQFENTLERLAQAVSTHAEGNHAHRMAIIPSQAADRQFYEIRDTTTGAAIADYTYSNGFMILGPSRAIVLDALHIYQSGNSLARSAAFRALLPKDENQNYSAVAYQNVSPVLAPLLSQLSGESADAVRKLAADSKPTAICAWGKDNRIEVASDSRLFGFDFLTLGALLDPGNKFKAERVKE